MSGQLELPLWDRGEAPKAQRSEESPTATNEIVRSGASDLMAAVLTRRNLQVLVEASEEEQGQSGHRWDDGRRVA
jgi:hypothetical protein